MANFKHHETQFSENRSAISFFLVSVFVASFLFCFSTNISAQDDDIPKDVVPPPLSVLSKFDKKSLEAETKMSRRTKLALRLMDSRLLKATRYSKEDEFQKSLNELGHFHAILKNIYKYLKSYENKRGSLKNFKRLEITLRKFLPRLELIRRRTPFKYGYHVRRLIKNVREARSNAIKPFYSDTVIRERSK